MRSSTSLLSFVLLTVHLANAAVYQSLSALPTNKGYDVIIVGGGTAGPVIASRLTENRRTSVLLVEAGPDDAGALDLLIPANYPAGIERKHHWNYTTTPQTGLNGRAIDYDRGHVLGGSSAINGMIYTRGAADDYDRWAEVTGDNGWSWNSLFPLIQRHEKWSGAVGGRNITGQFDPTVHGFNGNVMTALPWSGPHAFDEMCLETARTNPEFPFNLDINSGHPLGLTWAQSTFGGGERRSASHAYLTSSVRARPNLDILVNSRVTRVLRMGNGNSPVFRTIEIRTPAGATRTITARKEVVLAAGTINTPQILLHSGIGDPTDLQALGIPVRHELRDVGKNLHDHIATVAFGQTTVPDAPPVDRDAALLQWTNNRTGPFTEAVGHQILWTRLPENSDALQVHGPDPSPGSGAPHIEIALLTGLPGQLYGGAVVLMTPKSRGSVKIASTNPFDAPLIDLGFLSHPFDLEALKEGVRSLKRFYSGPAFSSYIATPIGPDPDVPEADFEGFVRNVAITTLHAVGTASMSRKGANHGVVDPDLKVKGLKGLSIADASVIPFVPTAHSMAPVYLLAERAADLIGARSH